MDAFGPINKLGGTVSGAAKAITKSLSTGDEDIDKKQAIKARNILKNKINTMKDNQARSQKLRVVSSSASKVGGDK